MCIRALFVTPKGIQRHYIEFANLVANEYSFKT